MSRCLCLVLAVLALPPLAVASPINSTSQGSFGTAQNINGFFSTNFLANVQNSTTIGHVEINQAGRPSNGYDFYRFTHAGGTVHLDVDDRSTGSFFDVEIGIWNSIGTLITANDDNGSDAGDSSFLNSAIFNLNLGAGDYIVGVARYNSFFQTGAPYITGAEIPQGGGYTLNISANGPGSVVPVPSSLVLLGTGMLSVGAWRLRRLRKA